MIKNFKSWLKSAKINESSNSVYEYGCAMVYYNMPQMAEIHSKINEEDIYTEDGDNTYGLEDEPHTTLLYGFHSDVDGNNVLDTCQSHKYEDLVLHNPSCFNNEKYDVLKFDVSQKEPVLNNCNSDLAKFPHTTNFPDYHPHCTIAYIKKGKGQHYADLFKDMKYSVTPNKLVYSMPSGDKLERVI